MQAFDICYTSCPECPALIWSAFNIFPAQQVWHKQAGICCSNKTPEIGNDKYKVFTVSSDAGPAHAFLLTLFKNRLTCNRISSSAKNRSRGSSAALPAHAALIHAFGSKAGSAKTDRSVMGAAAAVGAGQRLLGCSSCGG